MEVSKVFGLFETISNAELREVFQNARGQLGKVESAIDAYEDLRRHGNDEDADARMSDVNRAIENSEWSSLLQIQSALPFVARRQFRFFREKFLAKIESLEESTKRTNLASAVSAQQTIGDLKKSLDEWEERAGRARMRRRIVVAATTLLMSTAATIVLFFQFWHGDIRIESVSFLFPVDPDNEATFIKAKEFRRYRPAGESVPLFTVPDRDGFMEEFSRFYFNHPNEFVKQNFEKTPDDSFGESGSSSMPSSPEVYRDEVQNGLSLTELGKRYLVRWKTVLANTSHRSSEYVSRVRQTIEFQREEFFPWDKLHVSPRLRFSVAASEDEVSTPYFSTMTVENVGLGPALLMTWEFRVPSGDLLNEGHQFILTGQAVGYAQLIKEVKQESATKTPPKEAIEKGSCKRRSENVALGGRKT